MFLSFLPFLVVLSTSSWGGRTFPRRQNGHSPAAGKRWACHSRHRWTMGRKWGYRCSNWRLQVRGLENARFHKGYAMQLVGYSTKALWVVAVGKWVMSEGRCRWSTFHVLDWRRDEWRLKMVGITGATAIRTWTASSNIPSRGRVVVRMVLVLVYMSFTRIVILLVTATLAVVVVCFIGTTSVLGIVSFPALIVVVVVRVLLMLRMLLVLLLLLPLLVRLLVSTRRL